jgi:BRCT domain type II-containing protein
MVFVLSGAMPGFTRHELVTLIEANGGRVGSARAATHALFGEGASPEKELEARRSGCMPITLPVLKAMLA